MENLLYMKEYHFVKASFLLILCLTLQFSFGQQPYELLVTEIMADPTPTKGLPEKEYLELYNASNRMLQLSDYLLHYNTFQTDIPNKLISPNEYIILVRKGNEVSFEEFGNVVSLPKLSLINGGTVIRLSKGNRTVFEVTYKSDWYAEDKDQGYSLEMIDLNYPCVGQKNWTSSESLDGGTPGEPNAAARTNPDNIPPELLFFDAETSGELSFNFNERLDTNVVKIRSNYTLPEKNIIEKVVISAGEHSFTLMILNPLVENELIDISMRNMTDCSGNVADDINLTLGNLPPTDSGSVVLSETLFNPKLGGGDYIELYNRSDDPVSLKNWSFGNLNADGEMDDLERITDFNLLLKPTSYLVFTEDELFLRDFYADYQKENVVVVPKLPSMRNTDGTIFLLNSEGEVFDRFDYDEVFHHPIIDDKDGISLEKKNLDINSNVFENWQSAAVEVEFGTPGYKNSQGNQTEADNERVWVEPLVFTPNGDGLNDETFLNFAFVKAGNVLNARVFTVSGVPVKLLAENKLLGTSGKLVWNGTDSSGNELPVGYYIVVADIFNPDGITERHKKKVVLGRLN
jgi:hypothetical protein